MTTLFSRLLFESKTKKVQKSFGKVSLYVAGTEQSGPWEEKIWAKALSKITNCQKVLILGLGAGNLAKLINNKFPSATITGVEIDPEMIVIGKKFFALNNIPNLEIITADAFTFIKKEKNTYDLIFIDLFIGQNSPKRIDSADFIRNLSQTMSKNSVVIFNRLTTKTADFELDNFIDKLSKFMKIDQVVKVDFNNLIFCSRKEKHSPWDPSRMPQKMLE